jgi:hypothetical protein
LQKDSIGFLSADFHKFKNNWFSKMIFTNLKPINFQKQFSQVEYQKFNQFYQNDFLITKLPKMVKIRKNDFFSFIISYVHNFITFK